MIAMHCHMLPGIDDGARDLARARQAVADGIRHTVCTPHIYPGLYENTVEAIAAATSAFQADAGIPLTVSYGADIQIVPELVMGLQSGQLPTLHGSRYFLFEPLHHIQPLGMLELIHSAVAAGYVPVITHPERLTWAEGAYAQFAEAARLGAWIQLTGGSLLGVWGPRVKAFTERFLTDGITHLVASDGHNQSNRSPTLGPARGALVQLMGGEDAHRLVSERPAAVLANSTTADVAPPDPATPAPRRRRWWLGG